MATTSAGPTEAPATAGPADRGTDRTTVGLRVAVVLLVLAALAAPVLATMTGTRDGFMINGDEAVAALLPVQFERDGVDLVFPRNSYQGVLETPAYAVLWWAAGPYQVPMRLLHEVLWLAAVAVWAWLAIDVVGRATGAPTRSRWWGALVVAGLVATTSVAGWPVWYRIYPGYQLGALLAGLAVVVARRSRRWWHWAAAGGLAGLAVYAQPMHGAAVVAVAVAALVVVGGPSRPRRLLAAGGGLLAGMSPLILWNLRNSFDTLSPGSQPVAHPDWSYPQRLANTARVTARVLWGDGAVGLSSWASVARIGVAVVVVGLAVAGLVALVRAGRTAWPLLAVVVVDLLGLPLLRALSLDVDYRYAVGWWPALVVLVAAGGLAVAGAPRPALRRAAVGTVAVALVVHLAVVVDGAWLQVERRTPVPSAESATRDLAEDLRRCGVDVVAGDYWAIYPAVWGSDARLRSATFFGPDRLDANRPASWPRVRRVAVLPPPTVVNGQDAANLVALRTGRGRDGWVATVHPGTNVRVLLERTASPLPAGCVGENGLAPS